MTKLLPIFLLLTLVLGAYWVVMTGYFAERAVNLDIREAGGKSTVGDMVERLQSALDRTRKQHRLIESMGGLARNPDWSNMRLAQNSIQELLGQAKLGLTADDAAQVTVVENMKGELGGVKAVSVSALSGSQQAGVVVGFWVFLVASLVSWAAGVIQRATR